MPSDGILLSFGKHQEDNVFAGRIGATCACDHVISVILERRAERVEQRRSRHVFRLLRRHR